MSRQTMTAVALTLWGVACASLPGARKGDGASVQARADSVNVDVINDNYYAARIHAVYAGGQRRALGTIAGNGGRTSATLVWDPRPLVFEVLLVTDGATYVSHPVDLVPGQSIHVSVPSNISASGFFRRVWRN